jgi:hypothetical protein
VFVPASAFFDVAVELSRLVRHELQHSHAVFFRLEKGLSVLGAADQVAGEPVKTSAAVSSFRSFRQAPAPVSADEPEGCRNSTFRPRPVAFPPRTRRLSCRGVHLRGRAASPLLPIPAEVNSAARKTAAPQRALPSGLRPEAFPPHKRRLSCRGVHLRGTTGMACFSPAFEPRRRRTGDTRRPHAATHAHRHRVPRARRLLGR